MFLFNSIMLGVGLAMDAFSVSMADGLNEPYMKKGKMCEIAGIFAVFQALMPMTGWFVVCMCGLVLGKTFGTRLSGKAQVLGGVILIAIGLDVFISGVC